MIEFFRAWFYWWLFGLHVGWWKFRHCAAERAMLFVRQGVFFDLVLAHRIYVAELGEIFAYGDSGIAYVFNQEQSKVTRQLIKNLLEAQSKERKRLNRIFEPERFDVYEDERLLFMVDGEVVTSPLVGTGVPMEQTILSQFVRGTSVKQALDTLSDGNRSLNWGSMKWLLLIAAVAVIGFVVWKFVLKGHLPGVVSPTVTPTPTPTPTPNTSPIFTLYEWALWVASNA